MKKIGLYFLLFFCFSLHNCVLNHLPTVTNFALQYKNALPINNALQTTLKAHPKELPNASLYTVMQDILATNSSVALHSETLVTSYAHFFDTPGYGKTLLKILSNPDSEPIVRGHTYELEAALFLTLHLGKQIKAFNQIMTYGPYTCEYDLMTDDELYELKLINWRIYKKKQLGKQFRRQAALAELRKQDGKLPYIFSVLSGTKIIPGWENWFTEEGIPFQELLLAP